MSGTPENRATRLHRLARAVEASKQCYEDDLRAFHDEAEAAFNENRSVRWIAAAIDKSSTQAFRIIHSLTGPRARD
jgi:metal-dependent amidase/aminoacylase/carboxypeptidase family protein